MGDVRRRWFDGDATLACLAPIRAFVRACTAAVDSDDEATADLVQAVDEAATNVIVHGYRGDGPIEVEFELDEDRMVVRLLDVAPEFDVRAVPPPDLSIPPLERRPGGMGVHLMRALTDDLRHRPRAGGGNELTLIRDRRARGASEDADDGRLRR
mgnify:CR=1 FL=1